MYLPSGSSQDVSVTGVSTGIATIAYVVQGHDGSTLTSGTAAVTSGSATITIPATYNTLTVSPSWARRTVRWSYGSGFRIVNGRAVYKVELGVNHDADEDLVRRLVGVDEAELPGADIDLSAAYFNFRARVDGPTFDAAMLANDDQPLSLARAIAAQAALPLVTALQLRVAISETSGTNTSEISKIDWAAVRASLLEIIGYGMSTLTTGGTPGISIFTVGTPTTDAYTGATN